MIPKQLIIADHHEVMRSGLRSILGCHEGWEIIGEADNGKDAISLIVEKKPDVAILDDSLPLINGIEVTRTVKARGLPTEILIFTMDDSDALIRESFEAGARAFLLKSDAEGQLTSAVEALLVHNPFFTGVVCEKLLASYLSPSAGSSVALTSRERLVIQLISEGYSNKAISEELNLGVRTIEAIRASAMQKLSVKSTAALVRYAIRNQLVDL
jgi:DNA-binding NarL/FixJ family response regulator